MARARFAISGEHRLPACPFRQLAEKLFERSIQGILATRGSRRQAADDNGLPACASHEKRALRNLPPRGIAGFRFGRARRFKAKNRFAFFHEIETIARNRFQISHVGLEQIDLTSLTGQQILLFVYLLLLVVDLRAALHQFFIRRNEQAYDHQPDRKDQQDAKNSVKSLPDCGFATCAKISVAVIHLADCSVVNGFVTKFFFDPQQLIVLRDPIAAGKRPSFDLTSIRRDRDVGNGRVFRFA